VHVQHGARQSWHHVQAEGQLRSGVDLALLEAPDQKNAALAIADEKNPW
jgi:hypothetical protein